MENNDKFSFLDSDVAREPYIKDVLQEIENQQKQSLPEGEKSLATPDYLKKSGSLKIPFSPTRGKTIDYLLDLLVSNYPDHIRTFIVFDFNVDEASKKLSVKENKEYSVFLGEEEVTRIRAMRDVKSAENLLNLLKNYRFFNISKLLKVTKNKTDLLRIIESLEGNHIFTLKNYKIDKDKIETTEDICFHTSNYDSVRNSINISKLKDIVSHYNDLILRRLKSFGVLSTNFNDYRDSKLDYILNIMTDELATSLSDYDLVEVKNFQSLRSCILQTEKKLDPAQTLGNDIVTQVRDCKICTASDVVGNILELNDEILKKWTTLENLKTSNIITFSDDDGIVYYIDGSSFPALIKEKSEVFLKEPAKLSEMPHSEKTALTNHMNVLYKSARNILSSVERKMELKVSDEDEDIIKHIIEEYENFLKKQQYRQEALKKPQEFKKKKGLIAAIIDFFKGLFGGKKHVPVKGTTGGISHIKEISKDTKQFIKKVVGKQGPVIAISDLIELTPENDDLVDNYIDEMREHNVKIVIPIYNARTVLYPNRSQKLLMPDIEYLLVDPGTARSPESIRRFADTLMGYKIKNEIIPAKAIMVIEKYLLNHYRAKRAQMLKKEL